MEAGNGGIDYAAVLADLEAKRAGLDAAIAGVKQMLGQSHVAASSPSASGHGNGAGAISLRGDEFFQMSIPDASIKYLKMVKKPQTTKEIAEALEKGGMLHGSGDFIQTVGSVINRRSKAADSEVANVKRGVWGLSEWYPGVRRNKKGQDDQPGKDDPAASDLGVAS